MTKTIKNSGQAFLGHEMDVGGSWQGFHDREMDVGESWQGIHDREKIVGETWQAILDAGFLIIYCNLTFVMLETMLFY